MTVVGRALFATLVAAASAATIAAVSFAGVEAGQPDTGRRRRVNPGRTCPGECADPPAGRTCNDTRVPDKYANDPACTRMPCTESVTADLFPPPVELSAAPAAGKRVAETTPGFGFNASRVFHSLYLPPEWANASTSATYPIIVEYSGNTILPSEGNWTSHGWGISQGRGFIWVVLPFISGRYPNQTQPAHAATACMQRMYHGCAPESCGIFPYNDEMKPLCRAPHPAFDVQPTIDYAVATVAWLTQRYRGDPAKVLITGHSRGSLATTYIGLHDDRIAKLWTAFAPIAHFDGAHVTSTFPPCTPRLPALPSLPPPHPTPLSLYHTDLPFLIAPPRRPERHCRRCKGAAPTLGPPPRLRRRRVRRRHWASDGVP